MENVLPFKSNPFNNLNRGNDNTSYRRRAQLQALSEGHVKVVVLSPCGYADHIKSGIDIYHLLCDSFRICYRIHLGFVTGFIQDLLQDSFGVCYRIHLGFVTGFRVCYRIHLGFVTGFIWDLLKDLFRICYRIFHLLLKL